MPSVRAVYSGAKDSALRACGFDYDRDGCGSVVVQLRRCPRARLLVCSLEVRTKSYCHPESVINRGDTGGLHNRGNGNL